MFPAPRPLREARTRVGVGGLGSSPTAGRRARLRWRRGRPPTTRRTTSARASRVSEDVQREYADALLAGDPAAAETAIREAIQAGLGEAKIYDRVIGPALQMVGDLGPRVTSRSHRSTSRRPSRCACSCCSARPSVSHASGRRIACCSPRRKGSSTSSAWRWPPACSGTPADEVRLFGADLPVAEIAAAVDMHKPVAIGFTTAMPDSAMNLPAAFEAALTPTPTSASSWAGAPPTTAGGRRRRRLHPRRRRDRARRRARQTGRPQLSRAGTPEGCRSSGRRAGHPGSACPARRGQDDLPVGGRASARRRCWLPAAHAARAGRRRRSRQARRARGDAVGERRRPAEARGPIRLRLP